MDADLLSDLATRLEHAERRAKNLQRLLELGQAFTTEATKAEWSRRVAREVLRVARCRWAGYCVAGREVDRIFVHRQHASEPQVTIRPAGYLRRSAGDSWLGKLPCRLHGERFGLPSEHCWYLPVRVHEAVRGAVVLPQSCLGREPCGDVSELLEMLAHQVSLAAELAELHGDVGVDDVDGFADQPRGHQERVERASVADEELHRHGADQQVHPIGYGDEKQPGSAARRRPRGTTRVTSIAE